MLKKLLLVIFFVVPVMAQANSSFSSSKVTKIILHDWGRALIYLEGTVNTNEDCTNKGYIALHKDNQHFSEMYSAALAAYHSGSEIAGWVNGCDSKHNAPTLSRLDLLPK